MSIFDGQDDPLELDTVDEVVLFAVGILALGMFLGAVYFAANPTIDDRIHQRYLVEAPNQSGGTIQFTETQIRGMNKIYREKSVEYGFCLTVNGEEVTVVRHSSNITHNDRDNIHFQCSPSTTNGILHTHPGLLSVPELSEQDKQSLQNSDLEVSCVLSEAVPQQYWNENPPSLNCFNRELEKMHVEIVDPE